MRQCNIKRQRGYLMNKALIAHAIGIRLSTLEELSWDCRLALLRMSNKIFPFRRKRLRRLSALKGIKLHFGSGPRTFPGWINVDGFPHSGIDLQLDLRHRLPLADNSCLYIFSEHVLEHFNIEDGERICRELFRLLHTGGVARIIVPDAHKLIKAYQDSNFKWFQSVNYSGDRLLEGVNGFYYGHFHKCMYDYDLLHSILRKAGFNKIIESDFRGSDYPELRLDRDDINHQQCSLYIEATKTDDNE
jgi:predicted SAM-dependent methyltransferase